MMCIEYVSLIKFIYIYVLYTQIIDLVIIFIQMYHLCFVKFKSGSSIMILLGVSVQSVYGKHIVLNAERRETRSK